MPRPKQKTVVSGQKPDSVKHLKSTNKALEAYSRFVPREVLALMGKKSITEVRLGDHVEKIMTVMFTDIRGFTRLSEEMRPQDIFAFINAYLQQMEPLVIRNNGIVDKYLGDGFMALFPAGADDALNCANQMLRRLSDFNKDLEKNGKPPIRIGIGLNSGLMTLGTIGGRHRMDSTVISDAVNLASRIESMTRHYGAPLLISEHSYYGVRNISTHNTRFIDRVRVKGKEQPQSVYEVFDCDPPRLRTVKLKTKSLFEEALAQYHFKEIPRSLELLSECRRQAPDDTAVELYMKRCNHFLETGIHESSGEFDLRIKWDNSLAVGHEEIDAQHRELFDFVGELVEAILANRGYAQVQRIIEFLDDYIARHFETEEKCMKENDYPFLELQINDHRRFSRYFVNLKQEISKDFAKRRNFLLFRIQILLIDWLVNHTSKLDRHFGRFLRWADSPEYDCGIPT